MSLGFAIRERRVVWRGGGGVVEGEARWALKGDEMLGSPGSVCAVFRESAIAIENTAVELRVDYEV